MLRDSAPSKFAMMYLGKMDAEKFYFLKDTHTKNRKYEWLLLITTVTSVATLEKEYFDV